MSRIDRNMMAEMRSRDLDCAVSYDGGSTVACGRSAEVNSYRTERSVNYQRRLTSIFASLQAGLTSTTPRQEHVWRLQISCIVHCDRPGWLPAACKWPHT